MFIFLILYNPLQLVREGEESIINVIWRLNISSSPPRPIHCFLGGGDDDDGGGPRSCPLYIQRP